jgi:hypothetical protein
MVQHLDPAGSQPGGGDPFTFKGKTVVPMVQATLAASDKRWIYFVVYKDQSNPEKPKIRVEFKNGGRIVADQTSDLPESDKNGAIAMFVAAPSRPGDCELEITAMQGGQSATEHIAYLAAAR